LWIVLHDLWVVLLNLWVVLPVGGADRNSPSHPPTHTSLTNVRAIQGHTQPLNLRAQGYLAHKKVRPLPGSPQGPRHSPTAGSYGGAVSHERGTPLVRVGGSDRSSLSISPTRPTPTTVRAIRGHSQPITSKVAASGQNLIGVSIYDIYSRGPSIQPVFTRSLQ
jgi:hypothetical protein